MGDHLSSTPVIRPRAECRSPSLLANKRGSIVSAKQFVSYYKNFWAPLALCMFGNLVMLWVGSPLAAVGR